MSDPILVWNAISLEAVRISYVNGQGEQGGPVLSSRALALVHLAIHDAYFGIHDPTQPRYTAGLTSGLAQPVPAGSRPAEAVAAAAYTMLIFLYPSQKPYFEAMLDSLGDIGLNSPSHKYGQAVANFLIDVRKNDPGVGSTTYKPSPEQGKHRLDPDNPAQGFYAPDYGSLTAPFSVTLPFELAAPPHLDNTTASGFHERYLRALHEVRNKGIKPELMGSINRQEQRTADETLIGLYWAYDGATQLGTPPRFYNLIVREVARTQNNTVAENARLFALVNVALADAGIFAWREKYRHQFWRPVLGVREHHRSMGPSAGQAQGSDNIGQDCDTQWLPLGAPLTNQSGKNFTPPFPAYPSGHATFGAAALHMTRLFYKQGGRYSDGQGGINDQLQRHDTLFQDKTGQNLPLISEECNGISRDNQGTVRPRHVREFPHGLWQMIEENGRSRVYLGVHWVFDAFLTNETNDIELGLTESVDGRELAYGGVPLGLMIAENIYDAAGGGGPKASPLPAQTYKKVSHFATETQATPDWTQAR